MDTAKREYTVTTVPDEDCEKFTESSCKCESCLRMHLSIMEWDSFIPKTHLQRRMKEVVAKIEKEATRG